MNSLLFLPVRFSLLYILSFFYVRFYIFNLNITPPDDYLDVLRLLDNQDLIYFGRFFELDNYMNLIIFLSRFMESQTVLISLGSLCLAVLFTLLSYKKDTTNFIVCSYLYAVINFNMDLHSSILRFCISMTFLITTVIVIESKLKRLYKFFICGITSIIVFNLHIASLLLILIPFLPTNFSEISSFFKRNFLIKLFLSSSLIFIIYRTLSQSVLDVYQYKDVFFSVYSFSTIAYIFLLMAFAIERILYQRDNIIFKKLLIFIIFIFFLYLLNAHFWRYLVAIQYLLLYYSKNISNIFILIITSFSLYLLYLNGVA